MSWSTKEKAFCVEAFFIINSYKVQASFWRKFQCHHAPSKSRKFDWIQKFTEYVWKVWGILILVRQCRQSHNSCTQYPPIGRVHAVTGGQNSVPSPLIRLKKSSKPQIQIWSARNQWSLGFLSMKSAYTLQLLWAPLKARYLHITIVVGAHLKAK